MKVKIIGKILFNEWEAPVKGNLHVTYEGSI